MRKCSQQTQGNLPYTCVEPKAQEPHLRAGRSQKGVQHLGQFPQQALTPVGSPPAQKGQKAGSRQSEPLAGDSCPTWEKGSLGVWPLSHPRGMEQGLHSEQACLRPDVSLHPSSPSINALGRGQQSLLDREAQTPTSLPSTSIPPELNALAGPHLHSML